jgi:UDP-glucose 4-epimerase
VTERILIGHAEFKNPNIFNVGAGVSKSVLEMALLIQQRCGQVLGFKPDLFCKTIEPDELYPKLVYRTDHLTSLGFSPKNLDNIPEIDRLLQFCQSTFTQTKHANP